MTIKTLETMAKAHDSKRTVALAQEDVASVELIDRQAFTDVLDYMSDVDDVDDRVEASVALGNKYVAAINYATEILLPKLIGAYATAKRFEDEDAMRNVSELVQKVDAAMPDLIGELRDEPLESELGKLYANVMRIFNDYELSHALRYQAFDDRLSLNDYAAPEEGKVLVV